MSLECSYYNRNPSPTKEHTTGPGSLGDIFEEIEALIQDNLDGDLKCAAVQLMIVFNHPIKI